jgi:transcriptional regulator with XRE-family HTH domain
MLSAEQIRAARALLRWDQADVAKRAAVSIETVKRLEGMDGPLMAVRAATLATIQQSFEAAGIEFTNGDAPGVRLRKRPGESAGESKSVAKMIRGAGLAKVSKKSSEMASEAIDRLGDKSAPVEEQARRKRRLIKGPSEFREMRGQKPKA